MYLNITASKDTYIHNKIIANRFRATDSNTGYAGTLDLFKFYGESKVPASDSSTGTYALDTASPPDGVVDTVIELSRILIKFDLSDLSTLATTDLDITNDTSFECKLRLFDILDGQMAPTNFNVDVFPLAADFPEGIGRDTGAFSDLDIPNWVTASYDGAQTPPEILWEDTDGGAGSVGNIGAAVDAFQYLSDGVTDISASKEFVEGVEPFTFDVTSAVKEMIKAGGTLTNNGFRISFSSIEETDTKTYFLKRFASRHVLNQYLRPRLTVSWSDSFSDNSKNAIFDIPNTVMLQSTARGALAVSQFEDDSNELVLKLTSGSYTKTETATRVYAAFPTLGSAAAAVNKLGLYESTFTIPTEDGTRIVSDQAEIVRIEFVAHDEDTENLDGLYFKLYSDDATDNTYYIWFNVDGGNNDPNPDAGWTGVSIAVTPGDTAETIAATATTAIGNEADFTAETYSIGVTHVTLAVNGPAVDTAANVDVADSGFDVKIYQEAFETTIQDHIIASGSVTFDTSWENEDGSVVLEQGSLKVSSAEQSAFNAISRRLDVKIINAKPAYKTSERAKFRVFARDIDAEMSATRLPVSLDSIVLNEIYYQVRDVISNDIIIPFEQDKDGTRMSTDSGGMYFEIIMSSLFPGRSYAIDFLIIESGNQIFLPASDVRFRVDL